MGNTYSKEFTISSYDLTPQGKARLTTIAHFFQEMAYHHANQLGFGYNDLLENQTFWVLSRMKIRILRFPVWDERITVETWHRGMERLFGLRDFRVTDGPGEVIGVASSAWLILDSRTRRPVRTPGNLLHHSQGMEAVFQENLGKIHLPDQMVDMPPRKVRFSDLDIMGHVNNVQYMEWCIDAVMVDEYVDREIGEFEINYMQEALLGDEIQLSRNPALADAPESQILFRGSRVQDEQEIFRARIGWA